MLSSCVLLTLWACTGPPPKALHRGVHFPPSKPKVPPLHQDLLHLLWTIPSQSGQHPSPPPSLWEREARGHLSPAAATFPCYGAARQTTSSTCAASHQPASELKAQAGKKSSCSAPSGARAAGVGSGSAGSASGGCSHQCSGGTGCGTARFPGREGEGCLRALSESKRIMKLRNSVLKESAYGAGLGSVEPPEPAALLGCGTRGGDLFTCLL